MEICLNSQRDSESFLSAYIEGWKLWGISPSVWIYFRIHVFMYGNCTVMTVPARQIDRHGPVSRHPVMHMVNFPDLRFYSFLSGIVIRLPVSAVVLTGIRADAGPPEQPADAGLPVVLFDKPVSL